MWKGAPGELSEGGRVLWKGAPGELSEGGRAVWKGAPGELSEGGRVLWKGAPGELSERVAGRCGRVLRVSYQRGWQGGVEGCSW